MCFSVGDVPGEGPGGAPAEPPGGTPVETVLGEAPGRDEMGDTATGRKRTPTRT